jgi:DNA polymerase-3 subunit beta
MQITILRSCLDAAVRRVSAAIVEKTSLPIFTCLQVEARGDTLILTGGDSDLTLRETLHDITCSEDGSFCVHAQSLREQLTWLSEQLLTIEVNLPSSTMTVFHSCGEFTLPVQSSDAYPVPPEEEIVASAIFGSDALLAAIERSQFATATNEIRMALTGVCFSLGADKADIVGTNGMVLLRNTQSISYPDADSCTTTEHIVPRRAARIISDMATATEDDITLRFGPRRGVIDQGDTHFTFVLIDANYPNYNAVIPGTNSCTICAKRSAIIESLRRALPSLDRSLSKVVLATGDGRVDISGLDESSGKRCRDMFPATCKGTGITIGVSAPILIQVLQALDGDDVQIEATDAARPMIITCPDDTGVDTLAVVMPVRTE